MQKLICSVVFATLASVFPSAVGGAETLRMTRPAPLDMATRAFVETFGKASVLSQADIKIDILEEGAIIRPGQVVPALQDKIIDLALVSYFSIAPKPSDGFATSLLGNPAIVSDAREQFAIQDSRYGDVIAAELGRQKLISLAYWNSSPSALFAKHPLKTWAALQDKKIVANDPNSKNLIKALGGVPTQLAGGEVHTAVTLGFVEGAEIGLNWPTLDKTALDPYRGGTVIANFRQPLGFLAAHQATWIRITERQRQALARAAKDAEEAARRVVISEEERFPSLVRDSQLQLVTFAQLGRSPGESDAQAVWLREAGDGGRAAVELLQKVKLEIGPPPPPRRGGAVPATPAAKVFFATIRNDERTADLADRFGIKRVDNPDLSCGAVAFALPAGRTIGEGYAGPISVQPGTLVATNDACHRMFGDAAEKAGGSLSIFIHGFNNTLADAVQRAIGFATDLQLSAPLVAWSWPSAHQIGMYDYDQDSVSWAGFHLQDLTRTLLSDPRIKRITLVSHSMGGRLAGSALEAAYGHPRKSVLGDVIFAAPDVIVPIFRQTASRFGAAAQRMSLYASSSDWALWYSSTNYHMDDLAGQGGAKVLVIKGVETIDATDVGSFPYHAYAFEAEEVLRDLKGLVSGNLPAASRGLKQIPKDGLFYWSIIRRRE